jgi:hypothetical protein
MRLRELVFVEGTISTLHQLSLAIRKASNRNSLTRVPRLFDLDSKYTIIRERGENAGDSEALVSAVRFGTSSAFEEFVRRVLVSRWLCPSHEGVSALDSKPDAYRQALLDRCVATVSTRRRQLEYFRGHQMRLAQQDSVKFRPTPQQHIKLKSDQQSTEHLLAVASKAPGPNLTISHEISNIDPSETVGSEFQSNAFRLPPPSSVASSTTSSSAAGGFRSGGPFEVPPPPKLGAEEKEKACPYCCLVLPAKTFLTERKAKRWEKHLLEDLQPYICLFKNCSMGGKSYSSFKAWQAHLSQPHPPSWLCPLHAEDADHVDQGSLLFDTLSSFENHLTTYHPDVDPLDTDLADRASQPAVIPQECFVCFEELLSLPILHRHMANHFKSMLLLALPWRDDIEEEKMMLSDRLMSSARPSDARRSLETDLSSIDIFESADTDAMLPGTGGQNYGPPPPEGGQQLKPKDFESLLSLVNANPITGEDRVRNSETWATAQMPNLSPDVDTPPPNLFPGLLGPQIVSDPEHVEIEYDKFLKHQDTANHFLAFGSFMASLGTAQARGLTPKAMSSGQRICSPWTSRKLALLHLVTISI